MRNQPRQPDGGAPAVAFVPFAPDPAWYERHWLQERPHLRNRRAGRRVTAVLAAVISLAGPRLEGSDPAAGPEVAPGLARR